MCAKRSISIIALALISLSQCGVPYREFDPFTLASPNACSSTSSPSSSNTDDPGWLASLRITLAASGLSEQLITDNSSLNYYAEDWGHYIHRQPLAVFVANNTSHVATLVRAACASRLSAHPFQILPRGGSGNTGGNTQAACGAPQVILDMGAMNKVTVNTDDREAWVEAGASWLQFVQATYVQGLRPTVIPDYLSITVGGIISVGGLGGDSARYGPITNQILAAEIITADGDIKTVTHGDPHFAAMRGGMGQFGIFTNVKFVLTNNYPHTRIFHILIGHFSQVSVASKKLLSLMVDMNGVDGVQCFAVQNVRNSIADAVAPEAQLERVNSSVNAILALPQKYAYFMEITSRGTLNTLPSISFISNHLRGLVDPRLVFSQDQVTANWDNRLKLYTVPRLIKLGAWQIPHPWGALYFEASPKSESSFDAYIQALDPLTGAGFGLVAIYPLPTLPFISGEPSSVVVPQNGTSFWHHTLGRTSVVLGTYDAQAEANRAIWEALNGVGRTTIYPIGVLPDIGHSDWSKHFTSTGFQLFTKTKVLLDPQFVFADTRNFGFN